MKRKNNVLIILILLLAMLPFRMCYLCLHPESLPEVSNSTQNIILSELRGEIYDCNMEKLVNREAENIIIARPERESAEILKNYLNKEQYNRLLGCINSSVPFICEEEVEEDRFLSETIYKRYGDDGFCCHVLGYINSVDNLGVSGIEKGFNTLLTEEDRIMYYTYNTTAHNKMLAGGKNEIVSENYYSQKGVSLTIDYDIQRIVENAMWLYDINKGAVVVLDSDSGEIRAMASRPCFNQNNVQASLDDENSPFLNRAVSAYSVGSVFKLVVAAAAVKEGKDDFTSFCDGSLTISEKTFACSDHAAHGSVNLEKAMAYSCNTYFIRLALETGAENIIRTARNMGFGKAFELSEGIYCMSGNLPQKEEITTDGDIANLSFGQGGLLATPLQIASAYACVAGTGTYVQPKLVKNIISSDGEKEEFLQTEYRYRAFSAEETSKLKKLLENNFNEGTCVDAKPQNCVSGGKTSTAQTGWLDEDGNEILHSWFAGYVETGNKSYTIVVFKENGQSGGKDCGPVFKEIAERIANNH